MSDPNPDFTSVLTGKTIVLGVSGSIAAYKSADLVSELRRAGAVVFVVMTESATHFISSLTLGTLSRNPVLTSMWDEDRGWQPGHIELADQADMLLVAPATANQIGNFANGCAPGPSFFDLSRNQGESHDGTGNERQDVSSCRDSG